MLEPEVEESIEDEQAKEEGNSEPEMEQPVLKPEVELTEESTKDELAKEEGKPVLHGPTGGADGGTNRG